MQAREPEVGEAVEVELVVECRRAGVEPERAEVDVVVASLPPGASGAIGWALRVLRNVPYVVEYRDPWTVGAFWAAGADGRPRDDPVTRSRVAVATRLEAALLRLAAGAVIVNGESHVEQLRTRFPDATAGKPVAYIPNGVDLEDVCTEQRPRDQQTLRLLHTGFFYHFHTPHNVISALRLVRRDHPKVLADVELEFMGDGFPPQLRREAEGWGLSDVLRFTPAASYSQALAAMQAADGLLILVPALASDRDRLSTKMYEYLSTDRPVLAVVHPDGATAVLLATVPDALVADNGDEAAIAKGIVEIIQLARIRRVAHAAGTRHVERHHYAERAARMHALLGAVVRSAPKRRRNK